MRNVTATTEKTIKYAICNRVTDHTSQNSLRVSKKVLSAIWYNSSNWSALVPYAICLKHAVTLTRGWIPCRPAALNFCWNDGYFKHALYTLSNICFETRKRLLKSPSEYIGFTTKYWIINVLNAASKSRLMIFLPFFEPPGRFVRSISLLTSRVSYFDHNWSIVICNSAQFGVFCTLTNTALMRLWAKSCAPNSFESCCLLIPMCTPWWQIQTCISDVTEAAACWKQSLTLDEDASTLRAPTLRHRRLSL